MPVEGKSSLTSHWAGLWALPCLACMALCGCAEFWDDVRSRDFSVKAYFSKAPDPLVVLRESTDGDKRCKALARLKEPKEHGGSDADQDQVIDILVTAATREKQPLCRLAAIQTLSSFKDPRAAKGLIEAFYGASAFAPDTATIIRCQAVTAVGRTRGPEAVELLARVVHEPPAEGTETEKQQAVDVRIAAARALGNFNEYRATQALVYVLGHDKDVALRDRAYESLQEATGEKLPPDAQAWAQFIDKQQSQDPTNPPAKRFKLVGWLPF